MNGIPWWVLWPAAVAVLASLAVCAVVLLALVAGWLLSPTYYRRPPE
jgi:hypothetical protein